MYVTLPITKFVYILKLNKLITKKHDQQNAININYVFVHRCGNWSRISYLCRSPMQSSVRRVVCYRQRRSFWKKTSNAGKLALRSGFFVYLELFPSKIMHLSLVKMTGSWFYILCGVQHLVSQQKDTDPEEYKRLHSEREAHLKRIQQLVEETSRLKADASRLEQSFTG